MHPIHAFRRAGRAAGFTLVELLIVVIILAIIAAIVIPQLSATTTDAKESALDTNLARMRTSIDLYYQQHSQDYPGTNDATGATCPGGGTAGAGSAATAPEKAKAFGSQLTMYTNAAGQACSTTDATFKFGPYLNTAELGEAGIPNNPITATNAVLVVSDGNLSMTSAVTTGGWKYDNVAGKLIADHSAYDDR